MEEKVARGAQFFQTQAVYDPVAFARFMHAVRPHQVTVLASCIVLRSGGMARRLHGSSRTSKSCATVPTSSPLVRSAASRRSSRRRDWSKQKNSEEWLRARS